MRSDFPRRVCALGTLSVAWIIAACDPAEERAETAGGTSVPTVDGITDEASSYLGQTVTVTGEVGRVGGPQLFTIEDNDPVGDEHLLVLSARPVAEILAGTKDPLADDDEVQVSGTVQRLVISEIERELGFDLDPEYEVEFRDRPVLVATSVQRVGGGSSEASSGTAAESPVTDVLVLVPVPGPRELVGRPVQLTGVPVQSVVSDKGFWIGPRPDQQVFVRLDEVSPSGASTEREVQVREGQQLTVFGTVDRVPAREELESKWGLSPTESKALARNEALYIAADSVRTLPG